MAVLIILVANLCENLAADGKSLETVFVFAVGVLCLLPVLPDLAAGVIRQDKMHSRLTCEVSSGSIDSFRRHVNV